MGRFNPTIPRMVSIRSCMMTENLRLWSWVTRKSRYDTSTSSKISIHPSIHPSIHTYIHTYMHIYIYTCIHTYTQWPADNGGTKEGEETRRKRKIIMEEDSDEVSERPFPFIVTIIIGVVVEIA
jgi:hypothetical protein